MSHSHKLHKLLYITCIYWDSYRRVLHMIFCKGKADALTGRGATRFACDTKLLPHPPTSLIQILHFCLTTPSSKLLIHSFKFKFSSFMPLTLSQCQLNLILFALPFFIFNCFYTESKTKKFQTR